MAELIAGQWAAALAAITFDGILERLITTGIVGLILGGVTLAVVKQQTKTLTTAVKDLRDTVARHEEQISDLRLGQVQEGRRALQEFATRSELLQVVTQQTGAWSRIEAAVEAHRREFGDKLDKVHGRITDVATQLATLAGREGPEEGKT